MTDLQLNLSEKQIQEMLFGDRGMAVLQEALFNQLLEAEMSTHLAAEPGERTSERQGYRNGSYERELTTRVGTLELEVPRDREGTFQTELFQRYQRSEKALVAALMQMVVQGVSTRRVKQITEELCGREFTKSTVSRLTERLDEQVQAWAERSLEAASYPFLICDALHVKVRREGAVRSTAVLLAVGISAEGRREILGLEVAYGETEAAYERLLTDLKERGLSGVEVATSDANDGLKNALTKLFPGVIWQRCQAHFRRNVIDQTSASLRDEMHEALDAILEASDPDQARTEMERARREFAGQADKALKVLKAGWEDATAVIALLDKYRRRLRTTNMLERFNEEIRRREKVIRIFPNDHSVWRLVGTLCAEQHEEWSTGRRYLKMDEYFRWKDEQTNPQPLQQAA